VGLFCRESESDRQHLIGCCPWEMAFFPKRIESLVSQMLQFSQFFIRNPAERLVSAFVTADPCTARFADVTLGAVGAPVDLGVLNEFSWISTIRATPAE